MPTFVVLSKLTDKGAETVFQKPERVKEVNKELEEMGVKVVHQYVMLGEWDFLNIVESPDEKTLLAALTNLNMRGTIRTATYRIIPVDEYLEAISKK
ncbi:MAG: GYD domain-containing protein [Desulfurococcales archaeon]|nr:GYD domain-containing protein [Desulfurococcales archaeon]MEB3806051.1 GYD domain-containing protein [Desulfurococcales archaeon]